MLGQTVELLSQLLWGRGTIALTLLCGLYFTAGTGFLPLTRLPTVLKRTVGSLFQKRDRKNGGVSPFAAVSTALGGRGRARWRAGCWRWPWAAQAASSGCGSAPFWA